MPRARRCRARTGAPRCSLQSRDVDALRSIAAARFLTTTQVSTLHFGSSVRVAQRRLRALLDLGLVTCSMQNELLHRPSLFRATRRGLEELADRGLSHGTERGRLPKPGKLRHSLAVRDVFVAAKRLEARGTWQDVEVRFDSGLTRDPILQAARLIPDLALSVRTEAMGARRLVLVEVDLGTEPLATLFAKMDRYDELRAQAPPYASAEVLFVLTRMGRKMRLTRALVGRRAQFATLDELDSALIACTYQVTALPCRPERTAHPPQSSAIAPPSGLRRARM
jgi:hypothetical protein